MIQVLKIENLLRNLFKGTKGNIKKSEISNFIAFGKKLAKTTAFKVEILKRRKILDFLRQFRNAVVAKID